MLHGPIIGPKAARVKQAAMNGSRDELGAGGRG